MTSKPDMSYIITMDNLYEVKVARYKIRISFHITETVSREQALAEAIAYRDSLYERYGLPKRNTNRPDVYVKSRQNPDAVAGVYLSIDERSDEKAAYAYVICKYKDDRWKTKRFSIAKLGYQKAWLEAFKLRFEYHPIGFKAEEMNIPVPSLLEYLSIMDLAPDIPSPKITIASPLPSKP